MSWPDAIAAFHAGPSRCVMAVTGGGASAIGELLSIPGGSNTLLEAIVPYSPASLDEWLGKPPEQYCCEATALAMATVAFQRAQELLGPAAGSAEHPVGLGCTASLVSARPKRGPHRAFAAVQTFERTVLFRLHLDKGRRDRAGEERLVSTAVLRALMAAAGIPDDDLPGWRLSGGDELSGDWVEAPPLLRQLLRRQRRLVWCQGGERLAGRMGSSPRGLLCGSFNPLHKGHLRLRDVAEKRLSTPVGFEMSLHNVDKPPLDYLTIRERMRQFPQHPLALTDAPTFLEKSRLLPGTVFVVGMDTAERVLDPAYHGGRKPLLAALGAIRDRGCRFLVAARSIGGQLRERIDLPVPRRFQSLFEGIPPEDFREDISSTDLRKQAEA